ncbi:hypothetical protein IF655_17725 [Streptomyces sp. DSM 110735]|uniref:hypothetical protein n=1 Tax=Streptomyces sp. DSM 110735 TaxID=2775031 RepID=UPI0018F785CA|nr:hypothetical protein [Streptomyces sp. DSM 110735]MBJ7905130.1 hypothetical protein [Streptomyces sp. DSM 110735]
MDFFDLCMMLILGVIAVTAVALVRRARQRRAAWASGLTARARVVRAWTTARVVNNVPQRVQWHEYDFTTGDGRAVRFKESGGPRDRDEGDVVVIHYAAHEPDKATAGEPLPGAEMVSTTVWLLLLAVIAGYVIHEWVTLSRF